MTHTVLVVALNWLWQVAVIVAIGHGLLRLTRPTAAVRHRLWSVVLIAALVLPALAAMAGRSQAVTEPVVVDALASPSAWIAPFTVPAPPWWLGILAVCLWGEWMALSAVRVSRAVVTLHGLRSSCTPFPSDRVARLTLWRREQGRGRGATLAVSSRVRGAAVLGFWRPIVAVSPSLIERLDDDDLDRIVAHELAHVRRRDDLSALLQALVDVAIGFHPAVRFAQRELSLAREIACDDWVVAADGAAAGYAACLVRVAELQIGEHPLLLPAALAPSQLSIRVTHVLRPPPGPRLSRLVRAAAAPLIVLATWLVASSPLVLLGSATTGDHLEATAPAPTSSADLAARVGVARRPADLSPAGGPSTDPASAETAAAPRLVAQDAPRPSDPAPSPRVRPSPPSETTATPDHMYQPTALPAVPTAPTPQSPPFAPAAAPAVIPSAELLRTSEAAPVVEQEGTMPWDVAAGAGVAVGEGSRRAAVKTAGFFTRFGKSIARSF